MRLLILIFLPAILSAQLSSSSLTGVVSDASSQPVPGARLTLRHAATGFSRSAQSALDGAYQAENLLPGEYTLQVAKTGFRTTEVSGIRLAVGQTGRLDFTLQPGTDSLTVTAAVPVVETRGASIGFRQEASSIRALPLSQRNVFALLTLGPGAIPRQLGGFGHDVVSDLEPARGAVALNPPVHGARSTMNAFVLDGVVNTDRNTFASAIKPPLESVLEFRAHTLLAPAEFPQAGGAVIDVVTRTGSRDMHGSLLEFFRNESADARGFFDDPALPRPIFRRNQFGGSLGGALPLPRTFFFAAYEGLRGRTAKSSLHRVPDEVLRSGDFTGQPPLFDPLTTNESGQREPFTGNRIPAGRIDPIARAYLDRFQPLPNRQGDSSNYLDATPSRFTDDLASARIDHDAQRLGRLFGRYTFNAERVRTAGFPLRPTQQSLRAQQAALGWTTGGGAWLGETRLAFTRLRTFKLPESAFQSNVAAELGISDVPDDPFNYGLPFFIVTSFTLVVDDGFLPQTQRDNLWQASQDVSLQRGPHTVKLGFLGTRFHLNYQLSRFARGQYNFTGGFTSQPGETAPSGNPFADFLLGYPQSTSRSVGPTLAYLRQSTWAGYVQDDWRVSRSLTLNTGLRYEYVAPFQQARGTLLNLDYSTLPAPPVLRAAEQPVRPDRNNFAPRVGAAWRTPKLPGPLGEWTLRAGYGVYFSPEIAVETYDLVRNGIRNQNNSANVSARPLLTIRDGFPQTATTGFPTYYGLDTEARTPYIQQWTAGLQRELPGRTLLELAYIGTKGTKLGRFRQLNTPLQTEIGANLAPRSGDIQQLRAFPLLGEIVQRQHIANSNYHGLQVRGERRLSSSFSMLASFVWSKSLDDADTVIPGLFDSVGAQDERNLRLERGLSFHHVGRRVSVGFVNQLPSPRTWRRALGGWELSGIVTLQDGTPLNPVYFAVDGANTGTPNRPDVVPGVAVKLPRSDRTADRFFNTAAFRDPQPFTFGNAGRNILPGPGANLFDLALHKRFALTETAAIRFRAEAFNVFNHPNFGIPGPYPDFGPFFGKIFSTGEPRRLQFGLRLDF